MPAYRCAICKREVEYAGGLPTLYPFCSERCKLVDLGKWLREQYTIDRDFTPEDATPPESPPPANG
jgi:endogenous inhibitor of DNA gyrase (YacG/DUF329 family)